MIVVSLLVSSLFLIPIAIWLAGRWSLVAPVVELEEQSAMARIESQRVARQRKMAEGRVADRPRRRDRAVGGARSRRAADPRHERAVLARQRDRRGRLHADDAARRDHHLYVYFDGRVRKELAGDLPPGELPAEIDVVG